MAATPAPRILVDLSTQLKVQSFTGTLCIHQNIGGDFDLAALPQDNSDLAVARLIKQMKSGLRTETVTLDDKGELQQPLPNGAIAVAVPDGDVSSSQAPFLVEVRREAPPQDLPDMSVSFTLPAATSKELGLQTKQAILDRIALYFSGATQGIQDASASTKRGPRAPKAAPATTETAPDSLVADVADAPAPVPDAESAAPITSDEPTTTDAAISGRRRNRR